MTNDKLKKVAEIVLVCGNFCNAGKASGSALGFKLDSLLKVHMPATPAVWWTLQSWYV